MSDQQNNRQGGMEGGWARDKEKVKGRSGQVPRSNEYLIERSGDVYILVGAGGSSYGD